MDKKFLINLPYNIKTIIWCNNNKFVNIQILNNTKKLVLIYKLTDLVFDKWSNSLMFKNFDLNKNNIKISFILDNFLKSWNTYIFKKIKFKGKGFRIKSFKKIKLTKFYFGRSHKTFVFLKKIKKIRINKYKFMLLSINKKKITNLSKKITLIKKINIYTLRGLRLSKQTIFKRKGKKGTYI